MARRSNNTESVVTDENTPEVEAVEVTDAPEVEVEAPVESEVGTDEAPATPAEVEVDFTAFNQAVETAVEAADETTGEIDLVNVSAVAAAYRALPSVKARNKAKRSVEDQMKESLAGGSPIKARAYMVLGDDACVSATATAAAGSTPRVPADPTQSYAERIAALRLAPSLVTVPEGADTEAADGKVDSLLEGALDQAKAYIEWLAIVPAEGEEKPAEPTASPVVKAAIKLAQGRTVAARSTGSRGGSTSGVRRDIAAHIQSAFADKEEGAFLTIAEIVKHKSSEYGDDAPSAGAVSARLFPASGKSTVTGVESGEREVNGKTVRGATKLAA